MRIDVGECEFEREEQPRKLAAGRRLCDRPQRLVRIERGQEFDRVAARSHRFRRRAARPRRRTSRRACQVRAVRIAHARPTGRLPPRVREKATQRRRPKSILALADARFDVRDFLIAALEPLGLRSGSLACGDDLGNVWSVLFEQALDRLRCGRRPRRADRDRCDRLRSSAASDAVTSCVALCSPRMRLRDLAELRADRGDAVHRFRRASETRDRAAIAVGERVRCGVDGLRDLRRVCEQRAPLAQPFEFAFLQLRAGDLARGESRVLEPPLQSRVVLAQRRQSPLATRATPRRARRIRARSVNAASPAYASSIARWRAGCKSTWCSCWPTTSSMIWPSSRSWPAVAGLPLMRADDRPAAVISRETTSGPPASRSSSEKPFSAKPRRRLRARFRARRTRTPAPRPHARRQRRRARRTRNRARR